MGRIPKTEKPSGLMSPNGNNSAQSNEDNQFTGMADHEYEKYCLLGCDTM
jgi:hypothetical protein